MPSFCIQEYNSTRREGASWFFGLPRVMMSYAYCSHNNIKKEGYYYCGVFCPARHRRFMDPLVRDTCGSSRCLTSSLDGGR